MKACKHYSKPFGETEIIPSNGYGWNAWLMVYENNKLVQSSFVAGLFWEYLQHLNAISRCRKEVNISKKEVEKRLKQIKDEWESLEGEM
jgi:hypothetical protein